MKSYPTDTIYLKCHSKISTLKKQCVLIVLLDRDNMFHGSNYSLTEYTHMGFCTKLNPGISLSDS